MDLEGIMLRKLDRDSQILYDVTDVCNLKNNKLANIKKKKKRQQTHKENKLMVASGGSRN